MTMQRDPGTGFEVETEIVWSRVLGVLLAFGLLMAGIYWLFGGSSSAPDPQALETAEPSPSSDEALSPTQAAVELTQNATPPERPAPAERLPTDEMSPDTAAANAADQEASRPAVVPSAAPPTPAPSPVQPATTQTGGDASATTPARSIPKAKKATQARADAAVSGAGENDQGAAESLKSGDYTVRPAETLQSIAKRLFGNESHWIYIAQANPGLKPNALRTGAKIHLPDVSALAKQRERQWDQIRKTLEKPSAKAQTITVHPGENLSVLAERAYGSATYWHRIAAANRDKIHDPMKIAVGTVLVIPPAPAK